MKKKPKQTSVLQSLSTWKEIKAAIEAAGVQDTDLVFMIDIGPNITKIHVDRNIENETALVEIGDHPILTKERGETEGARNTNFILKVS